MEVLFNNTSMFALTDKIQAEFAVFESIPGLRNWLHAIFLRDIQVLDIDRKFECQTGPNRGLYRHLMGPAGVGLIGTSLSRHLCQGTQALDYDTKPKPKVVDSTESDICIVWTPLTPLNTEA
jgi:hypothetical protein